MKVSEMIAKVISSLAKEIQTFRHCTIYEKIRQNFRPGAKDLPEHTNCTH